MSASTEVARRPVGHSGASVDVSERRALSVTGWLGVVILVLCALVGVLVDHGRPWVGITVVVIAVVVALSLVVVPPGQTRVILFFGRYVGTVRTPGFAMITPLTTRRGISIRVRNFETNRLKVNDADGNPVDIAAIVVWQVADTAKAVFAVEDYTDFVRVQSESALRHVATSHPYDDPSGEGTSLRGSTDVVAAGLAAEVAERVAVAGVEILEVRISHLAYASEIAQAMLRRQQASAVVAARSRIVEGAVGMVELALEKLSEREIVNLDEERKAAMVSNLMVVLCGDQPPSPIVNTGSLYS
jgi:regulator of protease activity HflC (stomatin/prohibitin superfamily)